MILLFINSIQGIYSQQCLPGFFTIFKLLSFYHNLDSSSHYLKYKKSERIEPLNEPNEIILIKYKGFSNHKNLIGESIVLVRYFPRFKHEFLEKYYKNSHILCVQHNDIYFGYLNDRLQLETEINNKYFQFDLSKHNDNRYYLPVLSIFY